MLQVSGPGRNVNLSTPEIEASQVAQWWRIHLPSRKGGLDPWVLKKEIATHSGILAWRIPWIEEPGGLQSGGTWLSNYAHTVSPYSLLSFILLTYCYHSFLSCSETMRIRGKGDHCILCLDPTDQWLFIQCCHPLCLCGNHTPNYHSASTFDNYYMITLFSIYFLNFLIF